MFKQEQPKTNTDCVRAGNRNSGTLVCPNVAGTPGRVGRPGKNGGYAGKSGMVCASVLYSISGYVY